MYPSEFSQAARIIAMASGNHMLAKSLAESQSDHRVRDLVKAQSAAVQAGGQGAALVGLRAASAEFVASLYGESVAVRIAEAMTPLPHAVPVAIVVADATAAIVGEGAPVPASRIALAGSVVEARKAAAIVVVTQELVRSASPAALGLLDLSLRAGAAAALDKAFIAIALDNAPTITATASPLADLRAVLSAVDQHGGRLLWAVGRDAASIAATAKTASGAQLFAGFGPAGGELLELPALVTDALPPGRIALINAGALGGEIAEVVVESTEHALIEMNDAPAETVTGATVMRSLWAENKVGLKATLWFGLEPIRDDGAAVLDAVAWAA